MHVTCRILEHYHAFHFFFQPPFLNELLCFLNSMYLRRMIKTKVRVDAKLNELLYRLTNWLGECVWTDIL